MLDHGGNSWAEKAIDRIRTTASVLLNQLSSNLGHEVPVRHPLFSWSFSHAAWILDRFSLKANTTAYRLVRGHDYRGKLREFGAPLLCFVGDNRKKKGDAKWKQGIFLTKSITNDMFLVHCDGGIRLTRSVKSIFDNWAEHLGLYRSLVVQPWQIEGALGNRIDPTGGIRSSTPEAVVPIHDIESEKEEEAVVELVPVPVPASKRMKPPPRFAAIAAEVAVPVEGIVSYPDRLPEGPVAGPPAEDATMTGERTAVMEAGGSIADDEVAEPASKRPRTTVW